MNTRKLLISTAFMLCLSTNINAQQSVSISNPPVELQTAHTADEIQSAILFGSPDDVKALIHSQAGANAMYECNSPLTLAIRSILDVQEQGSDALKYAIEKVKYLITQGADVNQEICQKNARFPLDVLLSIPLELQGYEELSNQAIDMELQKNGYCNIPNLISKPCKDITKNEIDNRNKVMLFVYIIYAISETSCLSPILGFPLLLLSNVFKEKLWKKQY